LPNYREEVDTSIADTLKEQIDDRFIRPLLEQQEVQLPHGTQPMDLLERFMHMQADPNNLNILATIYESFSTFGAQSPYFPQLLALI